MKGITSLFILSVFLTGCSGLTARVDDRLDDVAKSSSAINDAKLAHTENLFCNGQSTGAVARKYGPKAEIWDLYWGLCNTFRSLTGSITIPSALTEQLKE